MKTKTIPISEFEAHCTEELRSIEEGRQDQIAITRHGKVIAIACAPQPSPAPDSLLGAGIGHGKFGPNYDPHAPAIAYEEWGMHQDHSENSESAT